jgi:hypothetical protein
MPDVACYFSPQSGFAFWGQDRLDFVAPRFRELA